MAPVNVVKMGTLGEGTFGTVFKAKYVSKETLAAMLFPGYHS